MARSVEQALRDLAKSAGEAISGALSGTAEALDRAFAGPRASHQPLRKGDPIPVRVTAGKPRR